MFLTEGHLAEETAAVGSNTSSTGQDAAARRPTSSAGQAARLLREFAGGPRDRGVRELARALGLGKSTVHRLLQALVAEGLLDHDHASGTYRLNLAVYELGQTAAGHLRLKAATEPVIDDLRNRSGQTVQIGVLRGTDIIYVERRESSRGLQLFSSVPRRLPAHCTSSGKVLLADLEPARFAELYPGIWLPGLTQKSITTVAELARELDVARARGWAHNLGETLLEAASVAAPIRDPNGRAVAGVSVAVPVDQLQDAGLNRYVDLVQLGARAISRRLAMVELPTRTRRSPM